MKVASFLKALKGLDYEFTGGVSQDAIREASKQLGLSIPPGYADFLERLGSGYISYHEIIGLGGPTHLDVVRVTRILRQESAAPPFPRRLLPVLADGYGNYECLDTQGSLGDGDVPVVQWQHDGGPEQQYPVIAPSFEEWLDGLVAQIRAVEAGDR